MKEELVLHRCQNHEFGEINKFYYMDLEISRTFGGERKDRLSMADAAFLFKIRDIQIGFALLIKEADDTYNIDMGILKKYRGQGYGTEALRLLKNYLEKFQLNYLIETQARNMAANKSLINNGFVLVKKNDLFNYYN